MTNKTIKTAKKHRSDALSAIHESAQGMFAAGVITTERMGWYDESCLTPNNGVANNGVVTNEAPLIGHQAQ